MASYYRAHVMQLPVDINEELLSGMLMPVSLEDGSGHEFLYFYGPARLAQFVDIPQTSTPTSGSVPGMNAAGSVYKAP